MVKPRKPRAPSEESQAKATIEEARINQRSTILKAVIGLVGTVITAYVLYSAAQVPILLPIRLTQTAEARSASQTETARITLSSLMAQATETSSGVIPDASGKIAETSLPGIQTQVPELTTAPEGPVPTITIATLAGWHLLKDVPGQINDLVVSLENPQEVYAASGDYTGAGSGVFKSEDGGLSWQSVANGLPSHSVLALAFNHQKPPVLYAFLASGGEVYSTIDRGATWTLVGQIGLSSYETRLVVDPQQDGVLFALLKSEGLWRSRDGGATWQPAGVGLPGDGRSTYIQSFVIDSVNSNIQYAGTGGFVGNGHGVYKSVDGGNTWAAVNKGMFDVKVTALSLNPTSPEIVFAGGYDGEFFKSSDGGQNWQELSAQLPVQVSDHPAIRDIFIPPARPEQVYLVVEDAGLVASPDSGKTWSLLGEPGGFSFTEFTAFAYTTDLRGSPVVMLGISNGGGWWYGSP